VTAIELLAEVGDEKAESFEDDRVNIAILLSKPGRWRLDFLRGSILDLVVMVADEHSGRHCI
jgi:hypothetical protein